MLQDTERWSGEVPTDGIQRHLIENHESSRRFLAPVLLLLYGDVEKTGFYEKIGHRRCILNVLKHLWALPTHREAFRAIATVDLSLQGGGVLNSSGISFL
jgi:ubiquitin conjugation factor E4 B